jgi:hypothetical protein
MEESAHIHEVIEVSSGLEDKCKFIESWVLEAMRNPIFW